MSQLPSPARQEALLTGAMKYVGGPCQHGHDGLRYTKCGSCVACGHERNDAYPIAAYREANRDAFRARDRKYRAQRKAA